MYVYTEFDEAFVRRRVAQFSSQVRQRLADELTEEEFKPLRLMNGLYLQLHAYMLRVAIPYGTLRAEQMRVLAEIAETYDKGYGHFTTRQNIQFNWPRLMDVPAILDRLADVGMHCIQTSGNTIRNVTSDHFAGAAADEIEDPRPTAELIRQWSTDHPEFQWLPRKFKIAITGSPNDRAVTRAHDIGLRMVRDGAGEPGYEVIVGGGLGRSPFVGQVLRGFLPRADLLPYLEAALRVYNEAGRRDNKYKARIKILVHEGGIEDYRDRVERTFETVRAEFEAPSGELIEEIEGRFLVPKLRDEPMDAHERALAERPVYRSFFETNVEPHRHPGHGMVTISLKAVGATPGDATAAQMRVIADLAERHAYDEIRITHEQNVVLPHVPLGQLPAIYDALLEAGLATANVGLASDIIACPGMDYCALATARSIPIAQDIARALEGIEREVGPLKIKISGCINACGHHHVGHLGILGLEKGGVESYQVTLGGDGTEKMSIGERAGPGFAADEIVPAVERLVRGYLGFREGEETFLDAYRRLGPAPFKAALYPDNDDVPPSEEAA